MDMPWSIERDRSSERGRMQCYGIGEGLFPPLLIEIDF